MIEKTLILLKPDCIEGKHCGEVISRFEKAGLDIISTRMMQLEKNLLDEHYSHLTDKPFYPSIVEFMTSRPVLAMVLKGEDCVAKVRDLLGPTDSTKAEKGTIRGDFGKDVQFNVVHASDSPESAKAEVERFFGECCLVKETSCCCK